MKPPTAILPQAASPTPHADMRSAESGMDRAFPACHGAHARPMRLSGKVACNAGGAAIGALDRPDIYDLAVACHTYYDDENFRLFIIST
jgi:hypothetical protein